MLEKPLRTLIVDDEPVARDILREEIETIEGVQVVGEADNGLAALQLISTERPHMVLLDLQMPAMGGLELVRNLTPETSFPAIVIVTAWDQYAIRALDAGAIDYLLKPVSRERLMQAIEKVRRTTSRQTVERVAQLQELAASKDELPVRKIMAKAGAEYILLAASEVYAFQAEGDLVWILTAKNKYLATQTLKTLEERLRNSSFRRIHRSALVNLDHVRKMSSLSSQRWLVTLNNRAEFIVSKRQASGIRELLSW
jgi:two-component system LytT family response regulator